MFIPANNEPYTPSALNGGWPKQANQTVGRGFFTTPGRYVSGNLVRAVSSTFGDVWSQPRLFFNSLLPVEQQFLIDAIRFEISMIQSPVVKQNVITQLNRVSHDLAVRVATAIDLTAPPPDPTYYHNNKTAGVSVFNGTLSRLDGLRVGLLTTAASYANASATYSALAASLAAFNVDLIAVAEYLAPGINQTYSGSDASNFDAIIVADGAESLFTPNASSTLYPAGRPLQIVQSGYRWGKPVAAIGTGSAAFAAAGINGGPGVYVTTGAAITVGNFTPQLEAGLKTFKFLDRFPLDKPLNETGA